MKKIFSILLSVTIVISSNAQAVGIGTNSPNSSSLLDITSTAKGLLIPRMTSAQRSAIVSPANGLMVYDITTNSFWYYNNAGWTNMIQAGGGGGTFTLPYNTTVSLATTAFKIKNDEAWNAIEGESSSGTGISGISTDGKGVTGTSVTNNGVYGYSISGYGVYAKSYSEPGLFAFSTDGQAIYASSTNNSAVFATTINTNPGINAISSNTTGVAIKGNATGTGTTNVGVEGKSTNGYGVYANSTNGYGLRAFSNNNAGIYANSETGPAIITTNNSSTFASIVAENQNLSGESIRGNSFGHNAIVGLSNGTGKAGIRGEATGLGGNGVYGISSSNQGYGVYGYNLTGTGVYGFSNTGTGVKAVSNSGLALDVNGKLKIAGGNTIPSDGAVLTSDATGNAVWKNNRIAFKISGVNPSYNTAAEATSLKLHFLTEDYDYGNNYALHVGTNPTTNSSTFTVPKDGVYTIGGEVNITIESDVYNMWLAQLIIKRKRGGVTSTIEVYNLPIYNDDYWSNADERYATDVKLLAGDIVWIEASQHNNGGLAANVGGSFYAHLVFED